ncbi:MAG: hypothetical protein ACOC85_01390 [Thermoplasmatota archaeon]
MISVCDKVVITSSPSNVYGNGCASMGWVANTNEYFSISEDYGKHIRLTCGIETKRVAMGLKRLTSVTNQWKKKMKISK